MNSPVLLFDSSCVLCLGAVDFVARRDQGSFRFGALSSDAAKKLLGGIALPVHLDSIVLVEDGKAYWRSEAVVRVLQKLRGWKALAPILRLIPLKIRDWGYDFIASRRKRFLSKQEACALPPPALRQRLL